MREGMHSIRRTYRGPSVLQKTQRNRGILLRTRLTTWCGSDTDMYINTDADVLNRRWRSFRVRRTVYHIYQEQWRQYTGTWKCVYGICSMQNKIKKRIKSYRLHIKLNQNFKNSASDKESTHASTVYAVLRIKYKTNQIFRQQFQPHLT
jgi:hypothetical protein